MMNMISRTSMTSISGVVFISDIGTASRDQPAEREIEIAITRLLIKRDDISFNKKINAFGPNEKGGPQWNRPNRSA
jgi:hypothetical protein